MNAAVDKRHVFDHPIRSVAVIGAGPSGLPVARHLAETGLHVRVFERQEAAGGIWNWQPTIAPPLAIPSPPPSTAAFAPTFTASTALDVVSRIEDPDQRQKSLFSPPNPVYWTLSNNVPTDTMAVSDIRSAQLELTSFKFKDFPYPPGTAMNISHTAIAEYLRQYTKAFNLNRRTSYSTRVERVAKVIVGGERKWRLTLRQVRELNGTTLEEKYWTEVGCARLPSGVSGPAHNEQDFDAVTVATGHYNAPYIPPIPGLEGWGQKWPSTILHSQGYRTPEPYQGGVSLRGGTYDLMLSPDRLS
jgi:cation diffusion facilitator CzcD-associated flavoprotein CzcO